ncbi:GNAT family N-acetyltransferase [Massilia sp. SYSU DXS3249]
MPVRAARPDDASAIAGLFVQLGYPNANEDVAARLAERGDSMARVLVAEAGERVVGVVVVNLIAPLHVAGRWAMVSALVTDEAARGGGIGAALLGEAERYAREQGCSRMELSSSEHRTRAHALYERQGFDEVRKRFVKQLGAPG